MSILKVLTGFVPLVVFSLLAHAVPIGWAAAAGLVAALAVVAATARGGIKILPVAQAVILLAMTIVGLVGGWLVDAVLAQYGQGIVGLLLGLFMIVTAASMPFTAQTARDTVPQRLWHSREFLEVNRRVSIAWGLAVITLGVCHLVASLLQAEGTAPLVWLAVAWVPLILAFGMAGRYTKRTVATAHEAATAQETTERTAP